MKKYIAPICALISLLPSCQRTRSSCDVVKETYVHTYGVPVVKSDWEADGKNGKVIQLRKDGVTVTQNLQDGVRVGETTYSFPHSSTIQSVETYADGILMRARENYPTGVAALEKAFAGDGSLLQISSWYEEGTPAMMEQYSDGYLVNGEYRNLLNAIEARIEDGNGERIRRSSNGELISKDFIQNGEMIERVTYFSNGEPASITPYENGMIQGMRLTFLPGGLPLTVEQWIQNKQEGITIAYQNGEKIAEIPYVNGKKHGVEYRFRDGTQLESEVSWKEDIQHGPYTVHVDGQDQTEWYFQGHVIERALFERLNLVR